MEGAIHNRPGFTQIKYNHHIFLNGKGKKQGKFLKLSCMIIKYCEQLCKKYRKDELIYSY